MNDTQNVQEDSRQWFLRINGETIFGPVSTEGLIVWAEQGRILPGHEISVDRKQWMQAVLEPMLDMRWFVDDNLGELRGPLNRLAAEALLKSGKVAADAQLVSADDIEDNGNEASTPSQRQTLRQQGSDAALAGRIQELEQLVDTSADRVAKREKEIATLRKKLVETESALAETRSVSEQSRGEMKTAKQQVAELSTKLADQAHRAEAQAQRVASDEQLREAAEQRVQDAEARIGRLTAEVATLQAALREQESDFAELLTDANARDTMYQEQIATLNQVCALSPDEITRLREDQAALYDLMQSDVDELATVIEHEREQIEQLKELSTQRQQLLIERRQTLLQRLGNAPADMTRRAVLRQPVDAGSTRLRTEFDNLRITHEQELRRAEERERDLQHKIRVLETESGKLEVQVSEGDKRIRALEARTELLQQREQELADERKEREAEREQYQSNQEALLMRIETLEKASRPLTPNEMQSAEARAVKLAKWMRLKN